MATSYSKFTLTETLTPEQTDFFNTHGFIHFKNFITPQTVNSIIEASQEVERKWIKSEIKKVNGVPIKYGRDLDGSAIIQRFAFINQHHSTLSGLLLDPRLNSLLALAGKGARLGETEKDGMVFNHT